MKSILLAVLGVTFFQVLVSGASVPWYFDTNPITRRNLDSAKVQRELGARLSNTTVIFGSDDSRYAEATARWNAAAAPQIKVVIEVGQESDVPTIVKYCNQNGIKFLAVTGGHGHTKTLRSFHGVQIHMSQLNSITIHPETKSVWFGGGVVSGHVSRYLWDRGYVTTTGSCDCVGLLGAALGGGHGRHEGLYGMASDNFLQLNVVLGDGRVIRVNSTSHADLFWAMRGAGHNFGIVTSFEMNIFPRGPDTWHYHNYIWRGDKLDAVFNALNNLHQKGKTPVNMAANWGFFMMNTTISKDEPVIWWTFSYRGSAEDAKQYFVPFSAIESVYDESGNVPYPLVAKAQGTAADDFVCQKGNIRIGSTAGLQEYNLTAEHQLYDGFKRRIVTLPELAASTVILQEGYSTKAVSDRNPADSAYPFRDDHHLTLFNAIVPPGRRDLEDAAWDWAKEARDTWNKGQPGRTINAYVNYADGLESPEEWYGHEPWRLQRLRRLKRQYDPQNRFGFYNPVVQAR